MIRLKQLFAFTAALLIAVPAISAVPPIVPRPLSVEQGHGNFTITSATPIAVLTDELHTVAEIFAADIAPLFDGPLSVTDIPARRAISLNLASGLGEEEYTLSVTRRNVAVTGGSPRAVLYGLQSLRQLINGNRIPAVEIRDKPWFAYRGAMLDAARHFFPAADVKKFIDILALHKINRFHWHLTDDQGWRIEIKRYPKLTEFGSKRKGTMIEKQWGSCDNVPYGGYYTQDEIREVVAYAAARGITVVPEIDLPGHMLAALACYPELGCTGGPYEVETGWGVFEDVLCPGKEKTFEFLENVLTEVMELFPSEYIHIGGDECPKTRWEKCPACQARIKALGLKDDDRHSAEHYLQSYVTARIEKFLNEHGRRIIGWDEILEGELAPNATVMSWRGTEGGIYAAKMGHDAIMTPTTYCYLDYCQASDPENEPLNIGGYVPVEKLYSYEPVPDSLVNDYGKYIIGVQANLWTEYIPTNEQLEYMLLPRVAALSEVQWCDRGTREWTRFAQALPHMLQIYDRMGLNYATTVFGVTGLTEKNAETGAEEIVLSTIDQTPIHYTLDGSEPTAESPVYTDPIALDKEYTVKAAVFREEIPTRTFSKTFAPTAEKEE